jgi:hypothetical protein
VGLGKGLDEKDHRNGMQELWVGVPVRHMRMAIMEEEDRNIEKGRVDGSGCRCDVKL